MAAKSVSAAYEDMSCCKRSVFCRARQTIGPRSQRQLGFRALAHKATREVLMRRLTILSFLAALAAAAIAAPSLAGGINLSGPHYNLNIIGVEHPKTASMTRWDRQ